MAPVRPAVRNAIEVTRDTPWLWPVVNRGGTVALGWYSTQIDRSCGRFLSIRVLEGPFPSREAALEAAEGAAR